MNCPRCGKHNEEGAVFCSKCGLNLSKVAAETIPVTDVQHCYRHPSRQTLLSCGRCGRPICTDCTILGPAGPRCPECAKTSVPFRPASLLYNAKKGISGVARGGWWTYIIAMLAISMIGGLVRGCTSLLNPPHASPVQEEPDDTRQRGGL